jgi:hypothetical protein
MGRVNTSRAAASLVILSLLAARLAGAQTTPTYPELYRSLALPELPGAQIVSTGRQTTSLRDGLAIRLTTALSVPQTRDFYRGALLDSGWAETPSRGAPPGVPLARLRFTRDQLTCIITITSMPNGSQITINVVEL